MRIAALLLPLLCAAGCATFRSYDSELTRTVNLAEVGQVQSALDTLDKNNRLGSKDLLYYLEKGELLRLEGQYENSQTAWFKADAHVQKWEDEVRLSPDRLLADVGSFLLNDRLRPYEGADFEKVMLTTRMALNHVAIGEWDNARVAIKRTHEREAVIAEFRDKEVYEVEQQARKRGIKPSFKELNGYPVETIDSPEVNALKNGYQSAFSHYLAGFVYEALGEPSLAAAGYRLAIELHPGVPLLEKSLEGLDARVADLSSDRTELLVVIESGFAPGRVSRKFTLPFPTYHGLVLLPISVPVLREANPVPRIEAIDLDGVSGGEVPMLTSLDLMERRELRDEMPGILLRTIGRAISRGVLQYETQRRADNRADVGSALVSALTMIGSVVVEQADERSWRTLPAEIAVARVSVAPGRHKLALRTASGQHDFEVNVGGRYALVCVRLVGSRAFLLAPEGAASDLPTAQGAAATARVGLR